MENSNEYFEDLYSSRVKRINKLKILMEKNQGNITRIYNGMEFERNTLAILDYLLNKNIVESKKIFLEQL